LREIKAKMLEKKIPVDREHSSRAYDQHGKKVMENTESVSLSPNKGTPDGRES